MGEAFSQPAVVPTSGLGEPRPPAWIEESWICLFGLFNFAYAMKLFRHWEDKLPVLCIVSVSLLDLLVFLVAPNVWVLAAWLLLTIGPNACICPWNHHHQHLSTFHQPVLNRLLELCYALHTGITTNAWVLHHVLGHHVNYLDQAKDESAWKRRDGSTMGELEYTVVIALTGYLRAFQVARRYPRYQSGFFGMGLVVLLLLSVRIALNRPRRTQIFSESQTPAAVLRPATLCSRTALRDLRPRRPDCPYPLRAAQPQSGQLGRAGSRPQVPAAGSQWRCRALAG